MKFIPPQIPTLADEPPSGAGWVQHEIKYDGYRTQLVIEGNRVRAFTRNGHDWSARYKAIVKKRAGSACQRPFLTAKLSLSTRTACQTLQGCARLSPSNPKGWSCCLRPAASWGQDLRSLPLRKRKELLRRAIAPAEGRIQYSQHVEEDGQRSSGRWRRWNLRASCQSEPTAATAAGQARAG